MRSIRIKLCVIALCLASTCALASDMSSISNNDLKGQFSNLLKEGAAHLRTLQQGLKSSVPGSTFCEPLLSLWTVGSKGIDVIWEMLSRDMYPKYHEPGGFALLSDMALFYNFQNSMIFTSTSREGVSIETVCSRAVTTEESKALEKLAQSRLKWLNDSWAQERESDILLPASIQNIQSYVGGQKAALELY